MTYVCGNTGAASEPANLIDGANTLQKEMRMKLRTPPRKIAWMLILATFSLRVGVLSQSTAARHSAVPRTWDDAAISQLEVPLANPIGSPKHITAGYYYKIPVRPIYKQYPVYAPGREPAGYMDLAQTAGTSDSLERCRREARAGDGGRLA